MKNDAENQKKYPQNFFKRHSEHNPGNYITISTEIMKYRNSEGKPLPDEVIGYYLRLRTLQDGFYYNIKGISSITGKNKDTSAKRHNILKQHSNGKWYTKFTIRGVTKHLLCAGATTQKEALEIENGFIYKLQQQMNGVIPKDQKNVYFSSLID